MIRDGAFEWCGLKKIYYEANIPVKVSEYAFSDYQEPTLYVRAEALNKMYITKPWAYFEKLETYDFSGITLDSSTLSMYAGAATTLNVTKVGNLSELTWTSSNPEVATVDSNGTVTALSVGKSIYAHLFI